MRNEPGFLQPNQPVAYCSRGHALVTTDLMDRAAPHFVELLQKLVAHHAVAYHCDFHVGFLHAGHSATGCGPRRLSERQPAASPRAERMRIGLEQANGWRRYRSFARIPPSLAEALQKSAATVPAEQ